MARVKGDTGHQLKDKVGSGGSKETSDNEAFGPLVMLDKSGPPLSSPAFLASPLSSPSHSVSILIPFSQWYWGGALLSLPDLMAEASAEA